MISGSLIASNQSARAINLYGTWQYFDDSPNDSLDGHGGSTNELYGITSMEDANFIYIVFNSQFPLNGLPSNGANDGNINYGDIFLNFSPGLSLNAAINQGSVYGVQFAPGNNSGVFSGVWGDITLASVAAQNNGYYLQGYYNTLNNTLGRDKDGGQMFGYMSKDEFSSYMSYQPKPAGQYQPTPNVIGASNKKIAEITTLNKQELLKLGLDLSKFSVVGSDLVGVKFDKTGLPVSDLIISLLLNCNNDGLTGYHQRSQKPPIEVPEPGTILGFMVLIGVLLSNKRVEKSGLKAE
ncbi:putative PEP-CTERM exosortase interaction domain protein [Richelia sinica FACHB-800]|uniref:PEP-CTERM exosortase interaction domain protein n=2 Tax=Richelia TaxID=98443 RepID=A0A975TBC1_9NOST|nr:putative PEP-CTERM exosortase interaction domain protein [Richelia sinica FACHB-800]